MGILLGLAPFIAFAVLTRFVSPAASLWAAAAVSAALILRERMRGRSIKILELGTVVLFCTLAIYLTIRSVPLSIPAVRSVVDAGLLAIILVSLAVGQPFTLQYAREMVPETMHESPVFVRINYRITLVWAAAMVVAVGADLTMLLAPRVPLWVSIAASVGALGGAFWFTTAYPERVRAG